MADYVNFFQVEQKTPEEKWCLTPKLRKNEGFSSYPRALEWVKKNLSGCEYKITSHSIPISQWKKQKQKFNLRFV